RVNLDEPPRTVEDYLKQVIVSRNQCAEVVAVELDQSKFGISTSARQATVLIRQDQPSTAAPPLAWQEKQCADFSQLRSRLVVLRAQLKERLKENFGSRWQFPNTNNESSWKSFCLKKASGITDTIGAKAASVGHHEGTPPILELVLSLPTPQVNQLFAFQVDWFISDGYSPALMQWLYALMAVLEKPLDADVCASLRDLARQCRILRNTLPPDDPRLREFSFFIAIVANYFVQRDLAD
uniref:Gem-associated protein 2 n=1 Tax=Plectus sambesii TaxID=2011161 RepID=A0A914WWM1_9BILA